jgi:hypothetical protein
MSCGVSSRQVVREALLDRGAGPRVPRWRSLSPAFEIAGTWDFKWPLHSEILIAFQEPPEEMQISNPEFEAAKALVMQYARLWKLPSTLKLRFMEEDLDPPLGLDGPPLDRHRSSFLREDPEIPYDVLISLQDLPVHKFDPFRGKLAEHEEILLPVSALGSYARRADYGAPTMYLGRFGHFLRQKFVEYFEQSLAQQVIVHEFGHMLGLPHLHQHPGLILPQQDPVDDVQGRIEQLDWARSKFYKDEQSVRQMLDQVLGIAVPEDVVLDHLFRVWRGNEAFSDWPRLTTQVRERHEQEGSLNSVMTFPYYKFTRRGAPECAVCTSSDDAHRALAGTFTTEPGPEDKRMLALMYDPSVRS